MNTFNSFMLSTNNFSNKRTATNTHTDSLKKLLKLGQTMIVDKNFDIKQYLATAEDKFNPKNVLIKKLNNYSTEYNNFKKLNPNYYSSYTNNNFFNNNSIYTINTINSNSKIRADSFNNSISINNKNDKSNQSVLKNRQNAYFSPFSPNRCKNTKSNFNTSTHKNKKYYLNTYANYNTIKEQNNKTRKNNIYNNIFRLNQNAINTKNEIVNVKENDLEIDDEEDDEEDKKFFKVEKVIKAIKKNKYRNYDLYKCLDKINDKYDKKDVLIGIDSDILLNKYKENQKKIKEPKITLNTFITQRKEISINNLLIKLINKESNKLVKKEKEISEDFKNNKNNLEYDKKKFEEYSDKQKVECKRIELSLTEIQRINKELKAEIKKLENDLKFNEYEISKILTKMDLLRFYAKFSNDILDGDSTRFEKPLLSKNIDLYNNDYDCIIKEILDKFSDMIKFEVKKEKDKNDINYKKRRSSITKKKTKYIKEEGYFLDNPELIIHKINELEDNIIRLLASKKELILEVKKIQEKNNESLAYLIERNNDLQKEYNELLENFNEENKKFGNQIKKTGNTHININLRDKNNIIKDLYMNIINEFEPTIIKFNKYYGNEFNIINRKELSYFEEIISYGQKILENIEINLNTLLKQVKEDEKDDEKIFDKVIYNIKKDYRRIRQRNYMKSLKERQINLLKRAEEKSNRIIIISKKTEAPYLNKKEKVKEKVDLNLIKREEDNEMMTYQ